MEFSISVSGFYHLDIRGCLHKARQLGYDGVEAGYSDLFSFEREPRQRFVAEHQFRHDLVTDAVLCVQAARAAECGEAVLGHDPFMTRQAFDGATIRWGDGEEGWDGTSLSDQLYGASLSYVKQLLGRIRSSGGDIV